MQTTGEQQVSRDDLLMKALKGAVAGAVGVWLMDRLDWFMFRHEDQLARHRTEQVRPGGQAPARVAVKKAADALGTHLTASQLESAGLALHYALGIGPAAAYGALRERLPATSQGQDLLHGLGFGLGLFLIQDEGLNQAMGLSAKQKDYPWQAHARGLVAHLALGLVTNTVLNLLESPRPSGGRASRAAWQLVQYDTPHLMPPPDRSEMRISNASAH